LRCEAARTGGGMAVTIGILKGVNGRLKMGHFGS